MTLPVQPTPIYPIDWALTATYPATPGLKPWEGQATRVAPSQLYFTGQQPIPAEHHNYVLRDLSVATASVVPQIGVLYTQAREQEKASWQSAVIDWPASVTAAVQTPCWSISHGAWVLPYQDTNTAPAKYRTVSAPCGAVIYTQSFSPVRGATYASAPTGEMLAVQKNGSTIEYTLHSAAPGAGGTIITGILIASGVTGGVVDQTATVFYSRITNTFLVGISYLDTGNRAFDLFSVHPNTGVATSLSTPLGAPIRQSTHTVVPIFCDTASRCVVAFAANNFQTTLQITSSLVLTTSNTSFAATSGTDTLHPIGMLFQDGVLYLYAATIDPTSTGQRIQRATTDATAATWTMGTVNTGGRQFLFGAIGRTWFLFGARAGSQAQGTVSYVVCSADAGMTWQVVPAASGFATSTISLQSQACKVSYTPENGGAFCIAGLNGVLYSTVTSTSYGYSLTP